MATYTQIGSTVTVGAGGASSIDFTSIPSTYTDLLVMLSARCDWSGYPTALYLRFNSSASGYSSKRIGGNGSSASSSNGETTVLEIGNTDTSAATSNTFSSDFIYVPNYTGSNYKTVLVDNVTENNNSLAYENMVAGLWSNTSAITSISIFASGGNWVQYSTASLYGIKKD
jgi:hypothetical protein